MEGVAAGFFFAIAAAMKTAAAGAALFFPDCVYCPFLSVWKSQFIIHATIAPPSSLLFPLVFFWRSTGGKEGASPTQFSRQCRRLCVRERQERRHHALLPRD